MKGLSLQFINCFVGEKTWYELAVRRYCFGICLHVSGPLTTTLSLLSDCLCPLELPSQNAVDSSPGGKSTMQVPGIFLLRHRAKSGRTWKGNRMGNTEPYCPSIRTWFLFSELTSHDTRSPVLVCYKNTQHIRARSLFLPYFTTRLFRSLSQVGS